MNLCILGSFINEVYLWKMENNGFMFVGEIGVLFIILFLVVLINDIDIKRKLIK